MVLRTAGAGAHSLPGLAWQGGCRLFVGKVQQEGRDAREETHEVSLMRLISVRPHLQLLSQLFPFHPLRECNDRLACKVDCVLYAFPDLACANNPKQKLTFGGNLYSNLYLYTYPDENVQQKDAAVASWERCYNIMRRTTGELQGLTIDRRTVARTHTCFSGCRASKELTFKQKLPDGSPIVFSPPTSWVDMAPEGVAPVDSREPVSRLPGKAVLFFLGLGPSGREC